MTASRRFLLIATALLTTGWSAPQERPLAVAPDDATIRWSPCPPIFARGCEMTVLHGDPGRPNADVLLRVPAGFTIAAHTHTSAERMILVAGRLTVKYLDAPETTLAAGSYAYGPAGTPHRATCVGDEACVLFIAFEGPVDAHPYAGPLD